MSNIQARLKRIAYQTVPHWTETEYEEAVAKVAVGGEVDVRFGRKIVRVHHYLLNGGYSTRADICALFDRENIDTRRQAVESVVKVLAVKPHKDAALRWRTWDNEMVNDAEMIGVYIYEYKFWWKDRDGVARQVGLNTTYGRALAFVFGLTDELVWPDESEDSS